MESGDEATNCCTSQLTFTFTMSEDHSMAIYLVLGKGQAVYSASHLPTLVNGTCHESCKVNYFLLHFSKNNRNRTPHLLP